MNLSRVLEILRDELTYRQKKAAESWSPDPALTYGALIKALDDAIQQCANEEWENRMGDDL